MLETPEEMERLQHLLDLGAAVAEPHQRGIITDDRGLRIVAAKMFTFGTGQP
jgi:hypothetical protein